MSKTEPITFREKLAMFLMRQAYIWIEKIDRKAVPKLSSFTFTIEKGEGAVVHQYMNGIVVCPDWAKLPGATLFYINDYDYDKAHTEAVND